MTTKHLSEEELQQYSIDKSSCDIEASSHIQSCASCKANVEAYRQLFTVIHDQPKQVFGFDLSNLVLKQLPESKSKFSVNSVFVFLTVLAAAFSISIPVYLFRKYLSALFEGALSMTIYLIVITAIVILVFQSMEMYRKYQKQMSILN